MYVRQNDGKLIAAQPRQDVSRAQLMLHAQSHFLQVEISGVVPSIQAYPSGCRFNPRCPRATDVCLSVPPDITPLPADSLVRCHHHG